MALGLFCLATATLFHTNFANQNKLLHFKKDRAIVGGMFVLTIAGPGAVSLDRVVARLAKRLQRSRKSSPRTWQPVATCRWALSISHSKRIGRETASQSQSG